MKVNPKFLAICLMTLFSINLMTAQTADKQRNPEKRVAKKVDRLKTELALSATQVDQLTAIELAYAEKVKAAKAATTEKGAARETIKHLRAEKTTAIKGILNAEQAAKFETLKGAHKGRRGGKKGKRGRDGKNAATPEDRAAAHTTRLTEKLALTETQAVEVADINLAYAEKIQALKAADAEKGANREAVKTLKKEQRAAIKAVLTPEQVVAFEEMKGGRKGKGEKGKRGRK